MFKASIIIDKALIKSKIDDRLFGSFIEHLGRAVYGGIYEPGHPQADEDGFRKDVLELVKELRVPMIRYPGGNYVSAFKWEDSVGPAADRPKRLDLAWRAVEPNLVGIDEFSRWCEKAGSEVMMAMNLGTRGIEDARNLVEYCNHSEGSYFSDLRRSHGRKEPYNFRTWCLGNEMDGPWQVGMKTAEEYGTLAEEVAKAVKMYDRDIELVACGSSGPGIQTFPQWEATVLGHCYDHVDYISLHHYVANRADDIETFLAESTHFERYIKTVISTVDFVQAKKRNWNHRVRLSVDEWNVWDYLGEPSRANADWVEAPHLLETVYKFEDALVIGCFLIVLLRQSEQVRLGCLAQLVNTIAPIMTENGGPAWKQTIFWPFLHASLYGRGELIETLIQSPQYDNERFGNVPYFDAAAVFNREKNEISVFCVNRHTKDKAELSLRLGGFPNAKLIEWLVLENGDLKLTNTKANPDAVKPSSRTDISIDGELLSAELGPLSWNVIRLGLA